MAAAVYPMYDFHLPAKTIPGKNRRDSVKENEKQEERRAIPWEAVDPKPPVIQSGHMENRIRNEN